LVTSVPFEFEQDVLFTHARAVRRARIRLGWFGVRLPDTHQALWVLVAHDDERWHGLVLLTNIPLRTAHAVRQAYADWRLCSHIEHGYSFDHEEGLDVEDMRVETLEAESIQRMRCVRSPDSGT
jgi:hypothetical protein